MLNFGTICQSYHAHNGYVYGTLLSIILQKYITMNIIKDLIKETEQQCAIHVVSGSFIVGDYVFLSKYNDADSNDPWYIGFIDEIGLDRKGGFIRCYEAGQRCWRYAIKIDRETGDMLLSALANYR